MAWYDAVSDVGRKIMDSQKPSAPPKKKTLQDLIKEKQAQKDAIKKVPAEPSPAPTYTLGPKKPADKQPKEGDKRIGVKGGTEVYTAGSWVKDKQK